MIQILVSFVLTFSHPSFAESIEKHIQGKGYPNEETLSRELKSQYDVIEKDWDFSHKGEIGLDAHFLGVKESEIPDTFEYKGEKSSSLINEKNVKYINYSIPAVFAAYGVLFWDWGSVNGFRTRDEGWFGKNTYAGGTDKFAHMYSHYLLTRVSYDLYRDSGLSYETAAMNSVILASSVGLLIEVGDGLSHYGFSFQDIVSDAVGIGFGHLLNSNAYLNELIGFQFWWWNNSSDPTHKGHKFKDPIDDYNNQKYIFNIRFAAIPTLRDLKLTRYINFDIGYYSRGYKEGTTDTKREIFTGFSLNLSQLLRDLFPKSGYAYHASNFFRYYQPPATGFEAAYWEDRD